MSKLDCEIIVIGAGPAGIGTAIQLQKNGFTDFLVLEKSDSLGGTWRDQTYPGLTVDVPAITYSYSFELSSKFSRRFAPQKEMLAYWHECADKYNVNQYIRYNNGVEKSVFDEGSNCWHTYMEDGKVYISRYMISATGFLNVPKLPDIKGIDSFQGKLLHTSAWDHSYDFSGKRVAVIGTGATGIQVTPEIAPLVDHLDVYMRTPIWLLPKSDPPVSKRKKWALDNIPGYHHFQRLLITGLLDLIVFRGFTHYKQVKPLMLKAEKMGVEHLHNQIKDPELRRKLTPSYNYGCKRPSFSNTYFPVFNRDNAELITEGIEQITTDSIISQDGIERKVDAIICATGYQVFERGSCPTFPVYGKNGLFLDDYWEENRYQAYKGVTVNGFPNYFMTFGPYAISHISYVAMVENSLNHIIRVLKAGKKRGASKIEIKAQAQANDLKWVLKEREHMIWVQGNCAGSNSYYFDRHGDNPLMRPSNSATEWVKTKLFKISNYDFS